MKRDQPVQKGFYIKKIKAEVVLFVKSALFVSKSDSHERRSIKGDQPIFFFNLDVSDSHIIFFRRPLLVHHPGKNILVTDSMFERLSPANTTDAPPR